MMHQVILSSGLKTADTGVLTGAGLYYGATLIGGTDDSSLIVYDNTSAAGTAVDKLTTNVGTQVGDVTNVHGPFTVPILCSTGIFADVAGTSAEFIVWYQTMP